MNTRCETYIRQALAASGFVLIDAEVAYRLRGGDIWATRVATGFDFTDALSSVSAFVGSLKGVALYEALLEDGGRWVLVASRSELDLAMRIEYVTGITVLELRPANAAPAEAAARQTAGGNDIPAWPCSERTARLQAAGVRDERFTDASRFPPKRAGL